MNDSVLERRLVDSMRLDRAKPSRARADGVVMASGTTVGLALAVELRTGETFEEIMERLADVREACDHPVTRCDSCGEIV